MPAQISSNTAASPWHCRKPTIQVIMWLNIPMHMWCRISRRWRSYALKCGRSQKIHRTRLALMDSSQSSVIFIVWRSLADFAFSYSRYFCSKTADFCLWDCKSSGRIRHSRLSFGVWHLGQALYLMPTGLACSMWSANQDARIGHQQRILLSEHGHRELQWMSPPSRNCVTGSITIMVTSHSTCCLILL